MRSPLKKEKKTQPRPKKKNTLTPKKKPKKPKKKKQKKAGDPVPDVTLYGATPGDEVKLSSLGKKIALFAVPGAFTPTCDQRHVPGAIEKAEELKAAGADAIVFVSVNDPFVMAAWGERLGAQKAGIAMLADPRGVHAGPGRRRRPRRRGRARQQALQALFRGRLRRQVCCLQPRGGRGDGADVLCCRGRPGEAAQGGLIEKGREGKKKSGVFFFLSFFLFKLFQRQPEKKKGASFF